MLESPIVAGVVYVMAIALIVLGALGARKVLIVHTRRTREKNQRFLLAVAETPVVVEAVTTTDPEEVVEAPIEEDMAGAT